MKSYPFDRNVVNKYSSSEGYLSITGQFLTEVFIIGIDDETESIANNPQTYNSDYLFRIELENYSRWTLDYFLKEKKLEVAEFVEALELVRDEVHKDFDSIVKEILEDGFDDSTEYFTGAKAGVDSPKSYRVWSIYSDISSGLEYWLNDDFINQMPTVGFKWVMKDIYSLIALWSIDECLVYLNKGDSYKATTWLLRVERFSSEFGSDITSDLARLGGQARAKKYQPLKDFVIEKCKKTKYPSRRNAALSLKTEVLALAKEKNIHLSEMQAEHTITKWLKSYDLPAKVIL